MNSPIKKILKNSSYLVGARCMNIIVRAVYAVALARLLGPEQYGLYFYALGWYMVFLPFTSLGLWAVISKDVSESDALGKSTVSQTLALRAVLGFLVGTFCAVIGWSFHDDIAVKELVTVFSIAMIGRSLAIWVEHVFNAYSASKYVLKLEAIFRPLEAGSAVFILILGGELIHLVFLHALLWWLQGIYGFSLLNKCLFTISPNWDFKGIKRLLRKGLLLGMSSFFVVWYLQGPILLSRKGGVFTVLELGQIALLIQILSILSQIPQMLRMAALPIASQSVSQEGERDRYVVSWGLKLSWLVVSVMSLVAWYVGPWSVDLLFGNKFETAGQYVGFALYLLVPWTWGNFLWVRLLGQGELIKSTFSLFLGGFF